MFATNRLCVCVILVVTVAGVYFAGCDRMDATNPMLITPEGGSVMKIAMQVATDLGIEGGEISISKGELVFSQPLEFDEGQVTVVFPGLQPGIWHIAVQLWDEDGFILYEGDGEAEVHGGETTTASIVLSELHGNLEIEVILPDYEPPGVDWVQVYHVSGNEYARGLLQTVDAGYAVAGGTGLWPSSDTFLRKLDSSGNTAWYELYPQQYYDQGQALQITSDNGFIVGGFASQTPGGMEDFYLVRTDDMGSSMWTRIIGDDSYADYLVDLKITADDGYIMTGFTGPWSAHDVYLIKTDASGLVEWETSFSEPVRDIGMEVLQIDGGYIICGVTNSIGSGGYDYYVIRTDVTGGEMWSATYGGIHDDKAMGIIETTDGNFIVIGYTESYGNGAKDGWIMKIDSGGSCLWDKTYGGSEEDIFWSIDCAGDQEWLIAGSSASSGSGGFDGWLVRVDSEGNLVWDKKVGGEDDDEFRAGLKDDEGGYVATGWTKSYGANGMDVWLVRLLPEE